MKVVSKGEHAGKIYTQTDSTIIMRFDYSVLIDNYCTVRVLILAIYMYFYCESLYTCTDYNDNSII